MPKCLKSNLDRLILLRNALYTPSSLGRLAGADIEYDSDEQDIQLFHLSTDCLAFAFTMFASGLGPRRDLD